MMTRHAKSKEELEMACQKLRSGMELVPLVLLAGIVLGGQVHKVNHWLGRQKQELVEHLDLDGLSITSAQY